MGFSNGPRLCSSLACRRAAAEWGNPERAARHDLYLWVVVAMSVDSSWEWQIAVVHQTQQLINSLHGINRVLWPQFTQLGDPGYVFLIAFAVSGLAGRRTSEALSFRVLLVFMIADLLNAALKWPLKGNRPFWMDPTLEQ